MWPFGKKTEDRLKEEIAANPVLASLGLEVALEQKTAIIRGTVTREGQLNLIRMTAESINGVEGVDVSGVEVKDDRPSAQKDIPPNEGADEQVLSKAQAVIKELKEEGSASNPVEVVQRGDELIVRGAVGSQEELEDIIQRASKVAKVNSQNLQVVKNAKSLNEVDDDGDIVYTVKSGDTLSHLALHYYGDAGRNWYMKIAEANGIEDPNRIYVGQKLKIPGTPSSPDNLLTA